MPVVGARALVRDFVALTKPRIGAVFLRGVARVRRATGFTQPAWSVYKFSLLYLALLFVAMVADRLLLQR